MIYDLTQTIWDNMPVFPDTPHPALKRANTIEKDGFMETLLTMSSHTGTHMDAPAHTVKGAATLDRIPIERFVGRAVVVDCRELGAGGRITADMIKATPGYDSADFLLFCTGWDRYWNESKYLGDFPVMDDGDVQLLVELGVRGAGVDVISIDPITSMKNHGVLLPNGIFSIENLTGLAQLIGKQFTFYALPIKFVNADGAPIRAIAVTE